MSTDDRAAPGGPTAFEHWEVVELVASSDPSQSAANAEAELAALREAARAEGYAEGLTAGRIEGEQACGRMKQLVESFSTTLDNLDFRLAIRSEVRSALHPLDGFFQRRTPAFASSTLY